MGRTKKTSPILGAASAIIQDATGSLVAQTSSFNHTFEVAVDAVHADPNQARRSFEAAALAALATTLAAEGQLQPILVRRNPEARGQWIIVAGERRWRAAKLLGWSKLLAISHGGDAEVASLLENLQRVDLLPMEEARGLKRLLVEKGWTQDQVATALGRPKSDVSGTLNILKLPDHILQQVLTSEPAVTKNVLVEMSRITDLSTLDKLVGLAREGALTVKAIRAARNDASATPPPPNPAPTVDQPSLLKPMSRALAALHSKSGPLSEAEQSLLATLRDAIEEMLGASVGVSR
ncbi:ParB/RepB/Spo0J family partition protein [Acidisphaera sp. L21]|uniref:ParB/RepB/Spo0J family partition protein n=1 Tax=Acidisphaera sp. L21 TaxID=1641851 RepID=UPI00131E5092|nr:ParB/RepB/Spo0J family partition protein [Acidisphaera sp. L21]